MAVERVGLWGCSFKNQSTDQVSYVTAIPQLVHYTARITIAQEDTM